MRHTGVVLSALLLTLVAIVHILRLVYGWAVTVDTMDIPMRVSWIGVLVPGALAVSLWMHVDNK